MPTVAELLRMIAILFVAMLAPGRMIARVRKLNRVGLCLMAYGLAMDREAGCLLRYPGETLADVAARIDLYVWLAQDPYAARRHIARTARGRQRVQLAHCAPPTFAAARAWLAPPAAGDADVAFADSS